VWRSNGHGPRQEGRLASARLQVRVGGVVLVFMAGLAVGWVVARGPWIDSQPGPTDYAASTSDVPRVVLDALADSVPSDAHDDRATWELLHGFATRVTSLESLLEEAERRNLDAGSVARSAVAGLSDRQLQAILGRTLRLTPEELAEVDDVRAYANRLAEVAMAGVFEPGSVDDPSETDAASAFFASDLDPEDPESLAEHAFMSDARRIYAVFPLSDAARGKVMLKWYRTDSPELILFRYFQAPANEPYGWIWREQADGWPPGDYRVDVFSGDVDVALIARGRFTVHCSDPAGCG